MDIRVVFVVVETICLKKTFFKFVRNIFADKIFVRKKYFFIRSDFFYSTGVYPKMKQTEIKTKRN